MRTPESTVKLKDLFYIVLRNWRLLIVMALISALVFAGVAFYRNHKAESLDGSVNKVELTQTEIEKITKDATANDPDILVYNETIARLDKRSTSLKDRLTNSLYLSIDENAQPIVSFDVTVTPEEPSDLDTDTLAQRSYQLSLEFLRQVKADELIKYMSVQLNNNISGIWLDELVEYRRNGDNSLSVEITAPDRALALQLADLAQDFFLQGIREFISVPYLYDVELGEKELIIVKNPEISEQREGYAQERDRIKGEVVEAEEAIQARLGEILEDNRLVKEAGTATVKPVRQNVSKFALAGLFLGVLMAAFWSVYRAASSAVIRYPYDFADQTGLLFIGTVLVPGAENKVFSSGLDRLIDKAFYGRKSEEISHCGVEYIASMLSGLDLKTLDLTPGKRRLGLSLIGGEEGTAAELARALASEPEKEEDAYILDLSKIPADLDTEEGVRELRAADAAILVVQTRKTSVKTAFRSLEIALGMGKKVLGLIAEETRLN